MKAAAAARKHWAWRRSLAPADTSMLAPMPGRTIGRISTAMLLMLGFAVLACAAGGLYLTRLNDSRQAAARHVALETALGELHAVFGDVARFDTGQLGFLARRAGLDDLTFDADLTPDGSREAQSMHDAEGRIIGWFSWAPDRAFVRAMDLLWDLVAATGALLALNAFFAMRAMGRLGTALARSAETVRKLTTQDVPTGLPNRRAVLQRLDEVVAGRRSPCVAFALLDIDGFRDINDTLGRAGGDAMLRDIAERLKSALPANAALGRFDDDEFAVILAGDDPGAAAALIKQLSTALSAPFYLDQAWQISGGIGVAQTPDDGTTGDELQRHAGLALRAAKRAGRGGARRFAPQIHHEHAERRFFLRALETAVANKAFEVHYQPMVAAEGGAIVGVEALLRWNHPTRGAVAPSLFVPLAEESGLMNELGEIVLRRAFADAARWRQLTVSVNLSPVQIRSPALVGLIAALMAETGIEPPRVVLEVTEGVLIENPQEAGAKLDALRALGASTALDDFGTGYSSLSYLQKFHFDRLKIDRAFVASLGNTGNTGAIIQSIVTLGHALGMKVVAEGVETDEQRVLLRLAGCDEMQGFLFAKPATAAAIDRLLAEPPRAQARRNGAAAS